MEILCVELIKATKPLWCEERRLLIYWSQMLVSMALGWPLGVTFGAIITLDSLFSFKTWRLWPKHTKLRNCKCTLIIRKPRALSRSDIASTVIRTLFTSALDIHLPSGKRAHPKETLWSALTRFGGLMLDSKSSYFLTISQVSILRSFNAFFPHWDPQSQMLASDRNRTKLSNDWWSLSPTRQEEKCSFGPRSVWLWQHQRNFTPSQITIWNLLQMNAN